MDIKQLFAKLNITEKARSLNRDNLDTSLWMSYFDKFRVSIQPLHIYRDSLTLPLLYDETTSPV
jgi:hypothetical protein